MKIKESFKIPGTEVIVEAGTELVVQENRILENKQANEDLLTQYMSSFSEIAYEIVGDISVTVSRGLVDLGLTSLHYGELVIHTKESTLFIPLEKVQMRVENGIFIIDSENIYSLKIKLK